MLEALLVAVVYPNPIHLIVVLVVAGLCWYLIDTYMPENPFKVVLRVVIVLVLCLWLLQTFGVM